MPDRDGGLNAVVLRNTKGLGRLIDVQTRHLVQLQTQRRGLQRHQSGRRTEVMQRDSILGVFGSKFCPRDGNCQHIGCRGPTPIRLGQNTEHLIELLPVSLSSDHPRPGLVIETTGRPAGRFEAPNQILIRNRFVRKQVRTVASRDRRDHVLLNWIA